jgi:organic radical activating enzyme
MTSFEKKIQDLNLDLSVASVSTLQVNITKLCNQACRHCHVDSSPKRREMMSRDLIETCLSILKNNSEINSLDITGGAPELHPDFKYFVAEARKLSKGVMVRHNLTVTHDPHPITGISMMDLPSFFKEQKVEVVSSLPYYDKYFTDRQRGSGVFEKSIESLKMLNDLVPDHRILRWMMGRVARIYLEDLIGTKSMVRLGQHRAKTAYFLRLLLGIVPTVWTLFAKKVNAISESKRRAEHIGSIFLKDIIRRNYSGEVEFLIPMRVKDLRDLVEKPANGAGR